MRRLRVTITVETTEHFTGYARWCRANGFPMLVDSCQKVSPWHALGLGDRRTNYFCTIRDADYEIMRLRAPLMEIGWGKLRETNPIPVPQIDIEISALIAA